MVGDKTPDETPEPSSDPMIAEIFARGTRLNDVAAQWITRFHQHEAKAVAEIVNLVIRAAGCHVQIDEDDIAEPDNCPHRLGELQDEYNAVCGTDRSHAQF